jgi:hypothetical protein
MNHPKRPRDPNQLAKSIVDIATAQAFDWPQRPLIRKAASVGKLLNINVPCDLRIIVGRAFTARSRGGRCSGLCQGSGLVLLRTPPQLAASFMSGYGIVTGRARPDGALKLGRRNVPRPVRRRTRRWVARARRAHRAVHSKTDRAAFRAVTSGDCKSDRAGGTGPSRSSEPIPNA